MRERTRSTAARSTRSGGRDLELRVLLDRSILEVFANRRVTLTQRIYPTRGDSLGLALSAVGGRARLRRLDIWRLEA